MTSMTNANNMVENNGKILVHFNNFLTVNKKNGVDPSEVSKNILSKILNYDVDEFGLDAEVADAGRGIMFYGINEHDITVETEHLDSQLTHNHKTDFYRDIFQAIKDAQDTVNFVNFSIVLFKSTVESDVNAQHIYLDSHGEIQVGNYGYPLSSKPISLFLDSMDEE